MYDAVGLRHRPRQAPHPTEPPLSDSTFRVRIGIHRWFKLVLSVRFNAQRAALSVKHDIKWYPAFLRSS